MREDLRDERLGGLLESVVRGVVPRPEERLPAVLRRGARRRAARWTAVAAALAVFVGGIGWGAFQVRGAREQVTSLDTSTWTDYYDPAGWSTLYPGGWHLQTFSGPVGQVSLDGAFFSNVAYVFRHPDLGPNTITTAWDLSGLPDDAVVVDFQRFSGGPYISAGPDSTFPLSLDAAAPVTASPGPVAGKYLSLDPVVHGGRRFQLYVWLGVSASEQDREAASLIVSSITFGPDTRGWASAGSLETTGWALRYPSDWRRQDLPACPNAPARTGVVVTSTGFGFRNPRGELPGCGDRFVLAGFPRDGVALAVEPAGIRTGLFPPPPDTPFPLSLDLLQPTGGIVGGPRASYLDVVVDGDLAFFVTTWIGADAPPSAVEDVRAVISSLEVRGATRWTAYRDDVNGFSVTYPADWTVTPLGSPSVGPAPRGFVALATSGSVGRGEPCDAFPMPLAGLGWYDVALSIGRPSSPMEGPMMPSRPQAFRPGVGDVRRADQCAPRGFLRVSFLFAEGNRPWLIQAAFGSIAWNDAQVRHLVWHVLDSLRFEPY